jgi:hypothetical protein
VTGIAPFVFALVLFFFLDGVIIGVGCLVTLLFPTLRSVMRRPRGKFWWRFGRILRHKHWSWLS